jgi:tetratricopeptide (TPR) repeat protein
MATDVPAPIEAERARDAALAGGDPAQVGPAEMFLGAAYFEHHRPADALTSFLAAERAYADAGLRKEVAMAHVNQARCLSALDRRDEAVALYDAVGSEWASADPDLAYDAWGGLAKHFERTGETTRTDAVLDQLRDLVVSTGDQRRLTYFEDWAGRLLFDRGEHERSAALLASAARGYETLDEHRLAADALMFEAHAHYDAGHTHQAVDAYTRAATAYEAAGDEAGVANARHNLGVVSGR